jgi:hypothetical protein
MTYISSESANALLSELRPTTLKAPALEYVNKFLDELLVKLVTEAQSINPEHLRLNGAPAVFVDRGKLGRDAVDDAEILIHDWYSHSHFKVRELGFPPHGEGRGLVRSSDTFPVQQAIELMRLKVSMLSVRKSFPLRLCVGGGASLAQTDEPQVAFTHPFVGNSWMTAGVPLAPRVTV